MLNVDTEFKNLIPPLTDDEYKGLEASILEEGCRDALILWGDTIVDGHNRYEICTKHNIAFNTVQMDFDSRDDAMLWMIDNQKARRNLNAYARGTLEEKAISIIQKKAKDKEHERKTTFVKSQKSNLPDINTTQELAKRINTGEQTASRIININKAINKAVEENTTVAGQKPEELKSQLMTGEVSINQAYKAIKQPHVSFNSGNNEWYTPADIIETARTVMGSIDVDPASSELANKVVKAETYYTAETNGLTKEWYGNVWMNPPYSTELIDKFVDKLVEQKDNYKQAIVLVNNATETEWFEKIVNVASAVCFPRHRVKFYKPDGKVGAPLQGQAILYIGGASNKFTSAFSQLGWCADVLR